MAADRTNNQVLLDGRFTDGGSLHSVKEYIFANSLWSKFFLGGGDGIGLCVASICIDSLFLNLGGVRRAGVFPATLETVSSS